MATDENRVREMESDLNECTRVTGELRAQLDRLNELREKAIRLFAYYGSEDWFADREGEIPEGFAAGVLSEDAAYDAITELRATAFQMLEMGTDILKNWI